MQRDYNGYNYDDTFDAKISFSLIRVLKSEKMKLTPTLFHCHRSRIMIGLFMKTYSQKPIKITQFSSCGKIQKCFTYFEIF